MKTFLSNIQICLLCFLATVLTVIFLKDETLMWNAQLNDSKLSNFFVSLFTMEGTLITLFYYVNERRHAKKPVIFPERFFEIHLKETESTFSADWNIPPSLKVHTCDNVDFVLKNVGIGIAQNIYVKWKYDLEMIEVLTKDIYTLGRNFEPIIIPYLEDKSKVVINLPEEYLTCFGEKVLKQFKPGIIANYDYKNSLTKNNKLRYDDAIRQTILPKLNLLITFNDEQDKSQNECFNINILVGANNKLHFHWVQAKDTINRF